MLIRKFVDAKQDEYADLLKHLGSKDKYSVKFPLPNMKEIKDTEFFHWLSSWSPTFDIYLGGQKIEDRWATVHVLYMDVMSLKHGGLAWAHFYSPHDKQAMKYYQWLPCVHEFKEKRLGNCWHEYKCSKCNARYEVDSSD